MKHASKKFSLALIAVAFAAAGCPKQPVRPTPDQTLGPQGGGPGAINPTNVDTSGEMNGLQPRSANDDSNGVRGLLDSVYFETDQSNIREGERAKIQAAKAYLDSNPGSRLLLEGHCDWRGTAEYNLALGDRRANEVKKYLVTLGAPPDRIDTISKGSEDAAKNGDASAMGKDRRVEFVVMKQP